MKNHDMRYRISQINVALLLADDVYLVIFYLL